MVIEQEINFGVVLLAHADFDGFGDFEEGCDAAELPEPGDQVVIEELMAHCADVDRFAVAILIDGHSGLAGIEILGVGAHDLAFLRFDQIAPDSGGMQVAAGEGPLEDQVIFFVGRDWIELHDFHSEHIGQVVRVAAVGRDEMFIDEPGVEGSDEGAAVLDVQLEEVRFAAGHEMQRRSDHDLVTGEVLGGAGKIDRDIAVVEGIVKELNVISQPEEAGWLHWLLEGPIVVVTDENAGVGRDPAAFEDGSEHAQFLADLADFLVNTAAAFAVVAENAAVEFFGADPRLAPIKIKDAAGAA